MVDIDFQVEPPSMGIKNAPVLITRAAIHIMLNQRRVITADGSGGIVQRGQEILLDVAYLGRVLFETVEHEFNVLHIQLQKP
mgnify:CR=1 FL=1